MGKLAQFALHPLELKAAIQLKFFRTNEYPRNLELENSELQTCWYLLKETSRSFAAVIEELNPELRNAVMLFYLILRALDTIEDDMTIDKEIKLPILRSFDGKLLTKDWTFDGNSPTEHDRIVLVQFDKVLFEFHKLKSEYQDIIKDITFKMGNGMADYIENKEFNLSGLKTIKDYDLYCHYVAGLVGDGLTRLIVEAKFASSKIHENSNLWNNMGLFLQKTNIIRDYNEDLLDGRSFWPKEIWGKYAENYQDFLKLENEQEGLNCISELVANCLELIPDVLNYLSALEEDTIFNFCAIPQVMAIATLELVFQNPKVFHQNVKIRKGTTCYLILNSRTFKDVVAIFRYYIRQIHHKSSPIDPNYLRIGELCGKVEQFIEELYPSHLPKGVELIETELTKKIALRTKLDAKVEFKLEMENLKVNLFLAVTTSSLLIWGLVVYSVFFK